MEKNHSWNALIISHRTRAWKQKGRCLTSHSRYGCPSQRPLIIWKPIILRVPPSVLPPVSLSAPSLTHMARRNNDGSPTKTPRTWGREMLSPGARMYKVLECAFSIKFKHTGNPGSSRRRKLKGSTAGVTGTPLPGSLPAQSIRIIWEHFEMHILSFLS